MSVHTCYSPPWRAPSPPSPFKERPHVLQSTLAGLIPPFPLQGASTSQSTLAGPIPPFPLQGNQGVHPGFPLPRHTRALRGTEQDTRHPRPRCSDPPSRWGGVGGEGGQIPQSPQQSLHPSYSGAVLVTRRSSAVSP
eukprot:1194345-Prorocentrum_minimum.AAC.2